MIGVSNWLVIGYLNKGRDSKNSPDVHEPSGVKVVHADVAPGIVVRGLDHERFDPAVCPEIEPNRRGEPRVHFVVVAVPVPVNKTRRVSLIAHTVRE